jgi:allophanate hydrolase
MNLDLFALLAAFESGTDPREILELVYRRIQELGTRPIWLELLPKERALEALALAQQRKAVGESLPLLGIPFAVKDNIDVAGLPTTAACPAFSYVPKVSAAAVERLTLAGAIVIGKTNLDQFATGLVGARSPYGACSSVFDARYVSGGSSSGSALAVAHGLVSFSLGTDTAGSGRVPAAFNNLVGVKPTRGLVSARGVVPACRSLDCVSVFAKSVAEASAVLDVMTAFDPEDPFSLGAPSLGAPGAALERSGSELGAATTVKRLAGTKIGVLPARDLEFFGHAGYREAYAAARARLASLGAELVEIDYTPFADAARLLYEGPWLAERYAAVGAFLEEHGAEAHPVVRDIILKGKNISGADTFRGQYRLRELSRRALALLGGVDALFLPTAGTPLTLDEVERDPIAKNTQLGRYTNFVNLLDLAAIAVPAGFTAEKFPFGVTFVGPACSDARIAALAAEFVGEPATLPHAGGAPRRGGAKPGASQVLLSVVGAHLSGQPLNKQLLERGATLVKTCRTARDYRFYALAGTVPPKPGLVRVPGFAGPGIETEVWSLDVEAFGSFVALVPEPLAIGTVTLDDGSLVKGFVCEPRATDRAREITELGGWRAYLSSLN